MTSTLKSYNSKNGELSLPSLESLLSALLIYMRCCSFQPCTINNMSAELHCVCRNLCAVSAVQDAVGVPPAMSDKSIVPPHASR
jgi:hypothetical protein